MLRGTSDRKGVFGARKTLDWECRRAKAGRILKAPITRNIMGPKMKIDALVQK